MCGILPRVVFEVRVSSEALDGIDGTEVLPNVPVFRMVAVGSVPLLFTEDDGSKVLNHMLLCFAEDAVE